MKPAGPSLPHVGLGLLAVALLATGCGGPSADAKSGAGATVGMGGLRLAPDPAFAASRIEVVFDDPRIDASKCSFVWKRNGKALWRATGPSLDPHQVSRGDRVTVEAKVPGSAGEHSMFGQVDVVNLPPRITSVSLMMSPGPDLPKLEAGVECADGDGDAVSYQYRWFRNDALMPDAVEPSLPASALSRGDRLLVEVTAKDKESASLPARSDVFQVDNLPPRITSRPVVPATTDAAFRYQVQAEDADQDPLHFELVDGPGGMKVGPTGLVEWVLPSPNNRRGDHPVKIKVIDEEGGAAIQEFSIDFE